MQVIFVAMQQIRSAYLNAARFAPCHEDIKIPIRAEGNVEAGKILSQHKYLETLVCRPIRWMS